jgi:hypothetical protein
MSCNIYSVDGEEPCRLGIMPRPRGNDWLEDEIRSLKQQGVNVVVSLLTTEESSELCLDDESTLCEKHSCNICHSQYPTVSFLKAVTAFCNSSRLCIICEAPANVLSYIAVLASGVRR